MKAQCSFLFSLVISPRTGEPLCVQAWIRQSNKEVVELLLNKGADTKARTKVGSGWEDLVLSVQRDGKVVVHN
jgi:hypothetical protein